MCLVLGLWRLCSHVPMRVLCGITLLCIDPTFCCDLQNPASLFVNFCVCHIYLLLSSEPCVQNTKQCNTTNSRPCTRLKPAIIQHYSPTKLLFGDVLKRKLWKSAYRLIPSQSRVQKFGIIFVHSLCRNDKGRQCSQIHTLRPGWDSELGFPHLNFRLSLFPP